MQFEYRVGKLSDADYQNTKKDLQKELAGVLGEVDRLKVKLGMNGAITPPAPKLKTKVSEFVCPSCSATFEKELKFCGACGKPMKAVKA